MFRVLRLRKFSGERMKNNKIEFFSAVLIASKDLSRVASFYRDVIGIPLEEEHHGDTLGSKLSRRESPGRWML